MGLNWCIFNESFHTINKEMNLKGDWEQSLFYGSINGLFVLGCLVGTLVVPAFLKKPKGVALEVKGDQAWYGGTQNEDISPRKPEEAVIESNEFYFEIQERKQLAKLK